MRYIQKSDSLIIGEKKKEDKINLFGQFFIHPNQERNEEIKFCLKANVMNPFITTIFLLNERKYTDEELGISNYKIVQIVIGHRLKYSDVFDMSKQLLCTGYNIIANADIFFDDSIENVLKSDMCDKPIVACQLRYEFDGTPRGIKIFGPRADSQDAWIWHTKFSEMLEFNKAFNFLLGTPGCDNHITYLFKICGFSLVNDPQLIHCLHYHKTQIRNYTVKDTIKPPYILVTPKDAFVELTKDISFEDNTTLYNYIRDKQHKSYIIPRVAGIENISAFNIVYSNVPVRYDIMKNNAGVSIKNRQSMKRYATEYYDAFENCEIYAGWSKNSGEDNVYVGLNISQDIIQDEVYKEKKKIWAHAFDIYHYIKNTPWTLALEGKRILVISSFVESFKTKIPFLDKIYGREIFKDNTFVFIKPPSLAGYEKSEEWDVELKKFCLQLDKLIDEYDVALVSSGGLGNLISLYIYNSGKQAIYVGGVLQMYFGVYGQRWMDERKAVLNMYLNSHWSRPMISERPEGWKNIENNCYW